tara:strand:+ start:563 stop:781 length:219 start_codon:yes stop_codon:yes gene_type:complete
MTINEEQWIKDVVLKKTTEEKLKLLEDAYDAGFGMFWKLASIFLDAPMGEGGGLTTAEIDSVFKKKLKKEEL